MSVTLSGMTTDLSDVHSLNAYSSNLTTLSGLVVVLMMVVNLISNFFQSLRSLFAL